VTIREIRCEACGTRNRVPDYTVHRIPECGRCHSKLPEARATAIRRTLYRFRTLILVVLAAGGLALAGANAMISGRGRQIAETRQADVPQLASAPACAQYSLPTSALNDAYDASERPALLTIRTVTGLSYVVKLENLVVDLPPLLFFLEGGQSLDAAVPLGEFRLKYGAARHRCGDADPFGDDTSFSQADDTLTFARTVTGGDMGATHLTIELPLQGNGRAIAKSISRNEFYGRH
jgi:hypothetical protein